MIKNKYPKGMHFYVLKEKDMFKIVYTNDLNKRLATFNICIVNKSIYSYRLQLAL